jgi:peptidylprolyl isomerase
VILRKTQLMLVVAFGFLSGWSLQIHADQTDIEATQEKEKTIDYKKLSESLGNFIGRSVKDSEIQIDIPSLMKGVNAGASGEPAPLNNKEYEQQMAIAQEIGYQKSSKKNLQSADQFMAKNRNANGIVEAQDTQGKLQYQILKEGSGPVVEAHFTPQIHYTGKYEDGTVFQSSEEMGGPITIPVDQTIPGLSKGIVGMKEGEKRRLFIHPDLGYGTASQLPPNKLLIFDIEVVKANADPKDQKNSIGQNGDSDNDDEDMYDDEDEDEDEDDATNASIKPSNRTDQK